MKKLAMALMIVISMSLFSACGNDNKDKVLMATEAGFAPYEYLSGNEIVGVDVDIAQEIAKDMGKDIEIKNMNFDGALLAVQQGKVDFVAAGLSIKPERLEKMDFSIPYATSKQVIVVKKDAGVVNSEADIKETTKVGFQTGTTGQFYAEDDIKCDKKGYTKYSQAAQDLKNGKIDCIIMDEVPAKLIVKANPDLVILDKELFTDEYAIAVKKGNKELLEKINKTIERLKSEGKIEEFTIKHTEG